MEFSFEVDPDLDLAVGTELSFEEAAEEYAEDGVDLLDSNPVQPTEAKPGSEEKVRMLAARYSAGMPLWHDSDCYDHGPAPEGFGGDDGLGGEDDDDF